MVRVFVCCSLTFPRTHRLRLSPVLAVASLNVHCVYHGGRVLHLCVHHVREGWGGVGGVGEQTTRCTQRFSRSLSGGARLAHTPTSLPPLPVLCPHRLYSFAYWGHMYVSRKWNNKDNVHEELGT